MSNNEKELNSDLKFGLKSFITICSILLGIMIFVGVTYVVPAGQYLLDGNGTIWIYVRWFGLRWQYNWKYNGYGKLLNRRKGVYH